MIGEKSISEELEKEVQDFFFYKSLNGKKSVRNCTYSEP